MTTELEQKFYDTFGIESYTYYDCLSDYKLYDQQPCNRENCISCGAYRKLLYKPEITAEKLLQLLCIVINEYSRNGYTFYLDSTNVKELKEEILDALIGCIDATCDLFETEVKQIQQLFKGEKGIVDD